MNRFYTHKSKKGENKQLGVFLLILICVLFLSIGNALCHSKILPVTETAEVHFFSFVALRDQNICAFNDFLRSVIWGARGDIYCLLLIAFSRLTKIPRIFTYFIFAYRSLLFGFCGAYLIERIGRFDSFLFGSLFWLIFFVYHIIYFAILICFGDATLRWYSNGSAMISWGRYVLTVFVECALIILVNLIYYFLISKI